MKRTIWSQGWSVLGRDVVVSLYVDGREGLRFRALVSPGGSLTVLLRRSDT